MEEEEQGLECLFYYENIERCLTSSSPKHFYQKIHSFICLCCVKGILVGIVCQLCDMPSKTLA